MNRTTKPSQEQLKAFLRHRRLERQPPPSIDEIRRQLGWHLLDAPLADTRGYPRGYPR